MNLEVRIREITARFAENIGKAILASNVDEVFKDPSLKHAFRKTIPENLEIESSSGDGYAYWAGMAKSTEPLKPAKIRVLLVGARGVKKYEAVDALTGKRINLRSRKSRAKIEAKKKGYTFE